MPSQLPPDLIIRISLVRDNASIQELDPPIWRSFKVSSSVNLELLHDKIIAPVMGWERNYHTYYFQPAAPKTSSLSNVVNGDKPSNTTKTENQSEMDVNAKLIDRDGHLECQIQGDEYRGGTASKRDSIHYVQTNTTASDVMHVGKIVNEDCIRKPEDATIGDLLKEVGDRCIYNYDLGDCWYHCLEVEKIIPTEEANGEVLIMDGAMRCPMDDGDGSAAHQTQILDLLLKTRADPHDNETARKLAWNCFEKRSGLNVLGSFRPEEFDISERRVALATALGSRNSTRNMTKVFTNGKPFGMARIGQRHVVYKKEDDKFDHMGGYMTFHETFNVKPDPKDATLCYNCGSCHDLKSCSRCLSSFYCSRDCQKAHWGAGHQKQCKKEKRAHDKYCKEMETNSPDPNRFDHDGGFLPIKKYIPGKLRFQVGDFVECIVGEDVYGTGRIVKLNYRAPSWTPDHPSAPYQIKMDRESADRLGVPFQRALIYSDWDDDLKIRRLPEKKVSRKKGRGKRAK
mmetsp:Transcript_7133/g.16215  ORF Transcript_7133/g.16215 Transcript_7133/m.16215 type:complete len:513 (+) Transcript_7133:34-1572(+)